MFMGPLPWLNERPRGYIIYGYCDLLDDERDFSKDFFYAWDDTYPYGDHTLTNYGHLLRDNESFSIY